MTDLAYAQRVSEYFVAGAYQRSAQMSARSSQGGSHSHGMYGGGGSYSGSQSVQASEQASGTYVAGTYSYIEQRELGGYTNDIKGALLQGTYFRLVQGKGFDAGTPQPSKAEQVLNQVQGGKMATPKAQPQVTDVIARIKKGEFNGADYVLFGVVSSIDFTDALHPIQGTSNATRQYGLQLLADSRSSTPRPTRSRPRSLPRVKATTPRSFHPWRHCPAQPRQGHPRDVAKPRARRVPATGQPARLHRRAPSRGVRPPQPMGYPAGGGQAQPVPVPQQPEQVLILK